MRPVGPRGRAREHEVDLEAVPRELHGVLDDHADAPGELQVLGQEGHAHGRAIVAPCRQRWSRPNAVSAAAARSATARRLPRPGRDGRGPRAARPAGACGRASSMCARAPTRTPARGARDPRRTSWSRSRRSRAAGRLASLRAATLAVVAARATRRPSGVRPRPAHARPGATGGWRSRPLPIDDRLYADRAPLAAAAASAVRRPLDRAPRVGAHARQARARRRALRARAHRRRRSREVLAAHRHRDRAAPPSRGTASRRRRCCTSPPASCCSPSGSRPRAGSSRGSTSSRSTRATACVTILIQLRLRPDAYERVRVRGRLKAEEHRASRVWPRIVARPAARPARLRHRSIP